MIRSTEYPIWTQANNLHRLQMDNVSFASDTKNRVAVYVSGINDGSLSKDVILTPQPGLEGYEVRGDHTLYVPAGITLTVEAGATLMSEEDPKYIDIDGHLIMSGSITFASVITGFTAIYFPANGTGDINHAEINGIGYEAIVISQESENPVSIKDSVIRSVEHPISTQANNLHRLQMDNVSFASDTKNRVSIYVSGINDGSLSKDIILTPQPGLEGYEVRGDHTLYVPAGITLTVEAGATLMNEEDPKYIEVNGHLVTNGTITSASFITGFSSIYFPASGTSNINFAEINGAGYDAIGISQESDNPVAIKDSVIRSAEYPIWTQANNLHRLQMDNVSFASDTKNRVAVYISGLNDSSLSKNVILTPQPGLEGYEVRGDQTLYVPVGITLTVEAGATLMSEEDPKYLEVNGHLVTNGTITSASVITGFSSIYFPASGTSDINHAEINGAGTYAVAIDGETNNLVAITDSIIRGIDYPIGTGAKNVHRLQLDNVTFAAETKNRVAIEVSNMDNHDTLSNHVILTPQSGLEGYEVRWGNRLNIPAGITLTLQAGATLMSEENPRLIEVNGHLVTTGSITSTSVITGFSNIYFPASGTSHINHAEINGAGSYAVAIDGETNNLVVITDSIIRGTDYPIGTGAKNVHRLQMDNVTFAAETKNRVAIEVYSTDNHDTLSNNVILTPQPSLEGYEIRWGNRLNIPAKITLTLQAGATLMSEKDGQMIEVNGRFIANGTQLNPINITSANDSAPGEWGGISVNGGEVILNHTNLRNGKVNLALTSPTSTVTISNSTVINASQSGISVTEGLLNMECSVLSENGLAGLWVDSSGTPDVTINRTEIWGNGTGITNTNSTFIDARYNWWGASNGPGGDFSGSGDAAFGNILHSPWLNAPNDCAQPPFQLFLPIILASDD